MKVVRSALVVLALAGLLASTAVHAKSWFGTAAPAYSWALHVGVFVVWIPAIRAIQKRVGRSGEDEVSWQEMLGGCPASVSYGVKALFVYAVVNFAWFMLESAQGHASAS